MEVWVGRPSSLIENSPARRRPIWEVRCPKFPRAGAQGRGGFLPRSADRSRLGGALEKEDGRPSRCGTDSFTPGDDRERPLRWSVTCRAASSRTTRRKHAVGGWSPEHRPRRRDLPQRRGRPREGAVVPTAPQRGDRARLPHQVCSSSGAESSRRYLAAQPILLLGELVQHCVEVAWSGDQHVVEAFAAQGADEAFRDRVCAGCPDRGADDPDVGAGAPATARRHSPDLLTERPA